MYDTYMSTPGNTVKLGAIHSNIQTAESGPSVESQNSNFFGKKIQILGFPWCSTREDLSIDVSITTVGLTLTKLR